MTIIEKIKAEIERWLREYAEDSQFELGERYGYKRLLSFLSTIESEKSVPKDLEEAARKYQEDVHVDTTIYYCGADEDVYFANRIVDAVIAGAKWQKEQMMKDAVEGEFLYTPYPTIGLDDCKDYNFKDFDKVRVIVLPKEG